MLQTTTGTSSDLMLDNEVFSCLDAGRLWDTRVEVGGATSLGFELDLDLLVGDFFLSFVPPPVMFLRKLFSDLTWLSRTSVSWAIRKKSSMFSLVGGCMRDLT